MKRVGAMAVVAGGWLAAAGACPPRYTIEVFDGPGNSSLVYPAAINSSGAIVGDYHASPLADSKAFQWNGGPNIALVPMPAGTVASSAFDIADDGAIAGDYALSGGGGGGFLRVATEFIPLGLPEGANFANPYGVNSAHAIVGLASDSVTFVHAFRWIDGKFEDLTRLLVPPCTVAYGLSESGFITGVAGAGEGMSGSMAFLLQGNDATILPLPKGAYAATGFAVSENGIVCGEAYYPGSGSPPWTNRGFVWNGGNATDVGLLPDDAFSRLFSVNSGGDAVGVSFNMQVSHGILWHDGVLYNIKDLLIDPGSVTQLGANAINDAGQIAGFAKIPLSSSYFGARLTRVPPKIGDTDCTGIVNVDDLLNVINTWGPCEKGENCGTDLNEDREVNAEDLMIVLKNWDF